MSGSTSAGLTGDWWRPMIKACSNLSATHPGDAALPSGAKSRAMPGPSSGWSGRPRPCIWMKPAFCQKGTRFGGRLATPILRHAWARLENCQVGVFAGLGQGQRVALQVDFKLFLPESWVAGSSALSQSQAPREAARGGRSQAVRRSVYGGVGPSGLLAGLAGRSALRASTRGA